MNSNEFAQLFSRIQQQRRRIQYELDTMMVPAVVDEMSVLFTNPLEFYEFIGWAQDQTGLKHYMDDQQVMYGVDVLDVKHYAYHANFAFFRVKMEDLTVPDGWRIQIQSQYTVNPVKPYVHEIFDGLASGSIVHASYKVPSVHEAVRTLQMAGSDFQLVRYFESEHGDSVYVATKIGDIPYLHPRCPKKKPA